MTKLEPIVITEDHIERVVEQSMEGLNYQLQVNNFTQEQYELAVQALLRWAEGQLEKIHGGPKPTIH
jgi:hypothetical protein